MGQCGASHRQVVVWYRLDSQALSFNRRGLSQVLGEAVPVTYLLESTVVDRSLERGVDVVEVLANVGDEDHEEGVFRDRFGLRAARIVLDSSNDAVEEF